MYGIYDAGTSVLRYYRYWSDLICDDTLAAILHLLVCLIKDSFTHTFTESSYPGCPACRSGSLIASVIASVTGITSVIFYERLHLRWLTKAHRCYGRRSMLAIGQILLPTLIWHVTMKKHQTCPPPPKIDGWTWTCSILMVLAQLPFIDSLPSTPRSQILTAD